MKCADCGSNDARYIDESGALVCAICPLKAGRRSIRMLDVPALMEKVDQLNADVVAADERLAGVLDGTFAIGDGTAHAEIARLTARNAELITQCDLARTERRTADGIATAALDTAARMLNPALDIEIDRVRRLEQDGGRPHINKSREFQSDKYPTCPPGKVPLAVKDKTAQDLLWEYAQRRRVVDAEFADDLEFALKQEGHQPVSRKLPIR